MSGFVYIWFDSHRKMFYVGSHWGTPDDGYVCSSPWMQRAYKRRPHHFRRRILKTISTSREDLLIEEQRWLSMMKPEEMKGGRYYNIFASSGYRWHTNPTSRLSIGEKISVSIRKKRAEDPEYCEKVRLATAEGLKKSREKNPEKWSEIDRKKSEKLKGLWQGERREELLGRCGSRTRFNEHWRDHDRSEQIKALHEGRSEWLSDPENRRRCGDSMRGKKHKPERAARASKSMRAWRDAQFEEATKHLDGRVVHEECGKSLNTIIDRYGLSLKQVHYMLKRDGVEHKKGDGRPRGGAHNRGSRGMRWFNDGAKSVMSHSCPEGHTPGRL